MLNQHVGDRFSGVTGLSITAPIAAVTAAIVDGRQARDISPRPCWRLRRACAPPYPVGT
jgi:hypothetical protein